MAKQLRRRTRGNGEGSIYQQADGRWIGSVERPRGADGKRRRTRIVRRTRQEVVDEIADLKSRAAGGILVTHGQTLSDYLDFWLVEVAAPDVSDGSLSTYTAHVDRIRQHLGTVRIDRLTKAHVQTLANRLAESYAPKTRQLTLSTLRRAIEWGVPDYFPANPARGVRGPRHVAAKVDDSLTHEQADAVLRVGAGTRYYAAWWLALMYGLRIGEILALRWSDIDFDAESLTIRQAKTKAGERTLPFVPYQVRNPDDTMRFVDDTATVLAAHRELWRQGGRATLRPGEARVIALRPGDDRVFVAPEGGTLRAHRLRGWWNELLEEAEVPHMCRNCGTDRACFTTVRRFHMTRHTAATLLLNSGVEVEVVSAILGHSGIGITLGTYARVRADLVRKGFKQRGSVG
jgi:integrase